MAPKQDLLEGSGRITADTPASRPGLAVPRSPGVAGQKPSPSLEASGMETVYLDGPIPMYIIQMKRGQTATLTTRR